ncbi:hypothetical protein Taro_009090 [Colocasia esculenta]|uniref:AB hydrolase-1 domain-containing protein n=1 Tax=Colocasia esculenta TaxID=4460 RepID=A0A843U4T0_COLES|nr:hypothetical protein [Colocasia esculenta]
MEEKSQPCSSVSSGCFPPCLRMVARLANQRVPQADFPMLFSGLPTSPSHLSMGKFSMKMELLSSSSSSMPCHCTSSPNWKFVERNLDVRQQKLFHQSLCKHLNARSNCKWCFKFATRKSMGYSRKVFSCYAAGNLRSLRRVSMETDTVRKFSIPSLPDEPNGESSPITSCFWEWKPKLVVHYEKAGMKNVDSPAVLFLPGFGVGSFHYEKQLKDLGRDYRVWALDFLGQGRSLPSEDPTSSREEQDVVLQYEDVVWGFGEEPEPWAEELVYSIDLWKEQVYHFIHEDVAVVGGQNRTCDVMVYNKSVRIQPKSQVTAEPVYIVGNSLGGFVALYFAALNPQLVKGVTLLNATPFWGFLPNPQRSPRLAKVFPWSGTFPLPASVRKLTGFVWRKISNPMSIQRILKQVYADHSIEIDRLVSTIMEVTRHPAAAASFASIMFAPRGQLSFQESLSRCQRQGVPICLMYGKEDPWVKPIWGLKVKQQVPEAPYYEISPAGHCPHDEVPEVVNYLLRGWIKNLESQGSVALPLLEDSGSVEQSLCRHLEFTKEGARKSISVRFYGPLLSTRDVIISFLKSHLRSNSGNGSR